MQYTAPDRFLEYLLTKWHFFNFPFTGFVTPRFIKKSYCSGPALRCCSTVWPCRESLTLLNHTYHHSASFDGFGATMGYCSLTSVWNPDTRTSEPGAWGWMPSPLFYLSMLQNIIYMELVSACISLLVWASKFVECIVLVKSDIASTISFQTE